MPLTTDQLEQIMQDELNGKPARIKGREADEFRKEFRKDVELAEKNNWIIDIPGEIQVDETVTGNEEALSSPF